MSICQLASSTEAELSNPENVGHFFLVDVNRGGWKSLSLLHRECQHVVKTASLFSDPILRLGECTPLNPIRKLLFFVVLACHEPVLDGFDKLLSFFALST